MHCSQCGKPVLADAKFCQACGKSISKEIELESNSISLKNLAPGEQSPTKRLPFLLRSNLVAGILILSLIGIYASVLIPAFAGVDFDAGRNGGNLIFTSGIVFAYLWKRRNRSGWMGLLVGIAIAILVAGIAGGINGYVRGSSQQKQEAVKALSSIQNNMQRIEKSSVDSAGLPARIENMPAPSTQASGDFGEMERFMKEYMDRVVAQRNDYLLELQAIGWNSILDAQRLKNDVTFAESKVLIERAKAIVDKYEKKTTVLLRETRDRINAIPMSEAIKKEMLAGFDKGIEKNRGKIGEQWKLEKQVLLQFENIILLLAARKSWTVDGDKILFTDDDDLARFNSYAEKTQQIIQQQEKNQKNSFAEANMKLETAKNSIEQPAKMFKWTQNQLNEAYMRTLTKDQCVLKTIESLKVSCKDDACIKTMGGVLGDCATWAAGSKTEFCAAYDTNYDSVFCLPSTLDERRCQFIRVGKRVVCNQPQS